MRYWMIVLLAALAAMFPASAGANYLTVAHRAVVLSERHYWHGEAVKVRVGGCWRISRHVAKCPVSVIGVFSEDEQEGKWIPAAPTTYTYIVRVVR
jgi:hypothetical protein